jgi:hypothetical protein
MIVVSFLCHQRTVSSSKFHLEGDQFKIINCKLKLCHLKFDANVTRVKTLSHERVKIENDNMRQSKIRHDSQEGFTDDDMVLSRRRR